MSEARAEFPDKFRSQFLPNAGTHRGYIFRSSSEKQEVLFAVTRESIGQKFGVLYIAGKQGVKGIRLSLIDTGFDVASYQKNNQIRILDSEEFFLENPRKPQFKRIEQIADQLQKIITETLDSGYSSLTVLSETDMLVRKGFLQNYLEFDEWLAKGTAGLRASFVCAFDERELIASGAKDALTRVAQLHSSML
jgi:MEDS: MEthanogen/methylotroph, DcmR Sensory domain